MPKRDRHEKHWKFNGTQHKLIFEICFAFHNLLRVRVFWDIWIECLELVIRLYFITKPLNNPFQIYNNSTIFSHNVTSSTMNLLLAYDLQHLLNLNPRNSLCLSRFLYFFLFMNEMVLYIIYSAQMSVPCNKICLRANSK